MLCWAKVGQTPNGCCSSRALSVVVVPHFPSFNELSAANTLQALRQIPSARLWRWRSRADIFLGPCGGLGGIGVGKRGGSSARRP